jgi:hypothetical protein
MEFGCGAMELGYCTMTLGYGAMELGYGATNMLVNVATVQWFLPLPLVCIKS